MRKRLFEVIELSDGNDRLSRIYDVVMMGAIVTSLIPLAFKEINALFRASDYITAGILVIAFLIAAIYLFQRFFQLRQFFIIQPTRDNGILDPELQ